MARAVQSTLDAARFSRRQAATAAFKAEGAAALAQKPVEPTAAPAGQFVLKSFVMPGSGRTIHTWKLIHRIEADGRPSREPVGGVIHAPAIGRTLAFVSPRAFLLVQASFREALTQSARSEWGADISEAVWKLRPHLPGAASTTPTARQSVTIGGFEAMIQLFDRAAAAKSKKAFRPIVRLVCDDGAALELTVARSGSRQPGTINVATPGGRDTNRWFGRILRNGEFEVSPRETLPTAVPETLRRFAGDPLAGMVAYGRLFGKCSICNRTLKDPFSIDRGIGPICAERFGF